MFRGNRNLAQLILLSNTLQSILMGGLSNKTSKLGILLGLQSSE